jgi:hypothetical protein
MRVSKFVTKERTNIKSGCLHDCSLDIERKAKCKKYKKVSLKLFTNGYARNIHLLINRNYRFRRVGSSSSSLS